MILSRFCPFDKRKVIFERLGYCKRATVFLKNVSSKGLINVWVLYCVNVGHKLPYVALHFPT